MARRPTTAPGSRPDGERDPGRRARMAAKFQRIIEMPYMSPRELRELVWNKYS
jgi:hypothetical protein